MARISFGQSVEQRARTLLAVILNHVNQQDELFESSPYLEYRWDERSDSTTKFLLVVESTLDRLEKLSKALSSKLSRSDISEALKRLRDIEMFSYLHSDQGRSKWEFHIKLNSKNVNQNLDEFQKKWSIKKPSESVDINIRLPGGFQALILEKIDGFVGREYVFASIQEFLTGYPKGYFIIEADPGVGKSAILAQFIQNQIEDQTQSQPCFAHFNIRSQGINRSDQFLENICTQLCDYYKLPYKPLPSDAVKDGKILAKLLEEASAKLTGDKKIIIAIDALDEVDLQSQNQSANILYLPSYLPPNVYFILTRRKVELPFNVLAPVKICDLMSFSAESRRDIEVYIHNAAQHSQLQDWIVQKQLEATKFVQILADKSENNFMYLRYVIPQIQAGFYADLMLEALPQGLENYYEDHWERMGMRVKPLPADKINIVYVLSETKQPVSRQLIAKYVANSELNVQIVLDEWMQFIHEQEIELQICYSLYHMSFRDFLHRKDIVQAAGVSLCEIYGMIADELFGGIHDLF